MWGYIVKYKRIDVAAFLEVSSEHVPEYLTWLGERCCEERQIVGGKKGRNLTKPEKG